MTELIFGKREGWSQDDATIFQKLAQRYLILTEEQGGIAACVVAGHNLLHIENDVKRFSHPDNYWCYPFERAVQRYIKTTTNCKNIQCSYAKRESRRELLKHLSSSINGNPTVIGEQNIDQDKMSASSLAAGRQLIKICQNSATLINACNKGILIGGNNQVHLGKEVIELIKTTCLNGSEEIEIPDVAFSFRSLLKPRQGVDGQGLLYRKGESVILDIYGTCSVAVVTQFLCIAVNGQFQQFVEGRLIDECLDFEEENLEFEDTGCSLLQDDTRRCVVLPATSVLRKIITCRNPSNPLQLVAVDFQRKSMPLLNEDVIVPFFPVEGDMVSINRTDPAPWIGKIIRAHVIPRYQMARVCYYTKTARKEFNGALFDIFKPDRNFDNVSWNSILGLADGEWHGGSWKMPIPS